MSQFNLQNTLSIDQNYENGLLPQRNDKNLFYSQTSCRSNLKNFNLSSENRRIIRKTEGFIFQKIPINDFKYDFTVQKQISSWIKHLGWNFPTSSIKNIFKNHIFNYIYIWKDNQNNIIAYSVCYFSQKISHIAYVFYNPEFARTNLPIRLVLQTIIDSEKLGLDFCYLGRFSEDTGFYKRNMPGFEYYKDNNWINFDK